MTRAVAPTLALVLAACSRQPPPPAPAGAPPAAAPDLAAAGPAHVSGVTPLRREPSEAARAKGPGGKDVSNQLALLQRGERVTVLEARQDWAKVRASDDREGWLKRALVLEGGAAEATVVVPADVFDRPDLLAANARRKVEPGTLLLVVRTRPPFSEVNVSSGPNAWVLSERLATDEREVSVAKLMEKARWLARAGKPDEARQLLALARDRFAGSPLLDAFGAELGEGPTPGGEIVPASAPAPDAPAR